MRTKTTGPLPAGLNVVRRRFEAWRRNRSAGGGPRIPPHLWAAAVRAATEYGLCRTARTLGLDYTALKRRVAAVEPGIGRDGMPEPSSPAGAAFVELPAVASGGGCECLLEWEDPAGARMQVLLKDAQPAHLAALSRSFWGVGA
jgi:hypothetical protein